MTFKFPHSWCRQARTLAASILGEKPVKAKIELHGSFAQTYRGHGTDLALLAGLMGWLPDDARSPGSRDFR